MVLTGLIMNLQPALSQSRPRDLGIVLGVLKPGKGNSITDVDGVRVGHCTLMEGDRVRTGVTAIVPHPGNVFQEKVPAAVFVVAAVALATIQARRKRLKQ